MTQKEFLEELKKLEGWYKTPANAIRRQVADGIEECPLSAVANALYSRDYPYQLRQAVEAGELLDLSDELILDIIMAADMVTFPVKNVEDHFRVVKVASLRQCLESACLLEVKREE